MTRGLCSTDHLLWKRGRQGLVHRYFPFSSTSKEVSPYLWLFSKVTESTTNIFFFLLAFFIFTTVPQVTDDLID